MNCLIPSDAQNSGTEYPLRLSIDDDLHEPLRFVLLDGAFNAAHRPESRRVTAEPARVAAASVMPTRPSGGSM